jgi:hypothetical protein
MNTEYVRQPIPWTITDGGTYVLPLRGTVRWRLAGVCITAPNPPAADCLIAITVETGDGTIAARFEGLANPASTTTSLTFAPNAPLQTSSPFESGSLAYLPPDLWIEPWQRVRFTATNSAWVGASTVVTCECEEED